MTTRQAIIEAALLILSIDKGRGTTRCVEGTDDGREVVLIVRPVRKARKGKE